MALGRVEKRGMRGERREGKGVRKKKSMSYFPSFLFLGQGNFDKSGSEHSHKVLRGERYEKSSPSSVDVYFLERGDALLCIDR